MKWENLKENKCPHCEGDLYEDGKELRCDSCYFHIDRERAKMITRHRAHPTQAVVKMKWQLLRIDKCPICQSMLTRKEGAYAILKCMSPACTFHIREDVLSGYLKDPSHPVNRFPLSESEENIRYLSSLR